MRTITFIMIIALVILSLSLKAQTNVVGVNLETGKVLEYSTNGKGLFDNLDEMRYRLTDGRSERTEVTASSSYKCMAIVVGMNPNTNKWYGYSNMSDDMGYLDDQLIGRCRNAGRVECKMVVSRCK